MTQYKTLHFLAGLPRSGSTVLAAILNQNSETHVSTTSGLVTALNSVADIWTQDKILGENDPERKKLEHTMRGMINAFYDIPESVVIDKSRIWPRKDIIWSMKQVLKRKPKIIATVRSIPDCAASFVRIAKPENMNDFMYSSHLINHLKDSYAILQNGYKAFPECFLFVEYEDLIAKPEVELKRIHEFLELDTFEYNFNAIDGSTVQEEDEQLHGVVGLHDIKPKLEKQHNEDAKDVLKQYYSEFCQPEFWLDKPRTLPIIDNDLDLQLTAATNGDFDEAWRLAEKLRVEQPDNLRATYNRGWYLLREGKIQDGYTLMDKGRIAGVFGNSPPDVPTPKWDGKSKGVVLLNLEGGLGDQIHQVRYAKDIAARGCTVIVACTGHLVPLFIDVEGVSAVIQHNATFGIYHDFWVAGMSAVVPLGFELPDISGKPYLNKPDIERDSKKRIGLRWQGGTQFEHEHHKKFPYELMFEAVKDTDAEFISLQRDEGVEARPKWVKEVLLDTWKDTQKAVASCDLVISACTSVSHIAAAMGVNTWVVTPILPYFLYAQDGESTPYYDSMKLFRQKEFSKWEAPFDLIKERLSA